MNSLCYAVRKHEIKIGKALFNKRADLYQNLNCQFAKVCRVYLTLLWHNKESVIVKKTPQNTILKNFSIIEKSTFY